MKVPTTLEPHPSESREPEAHGASPRSSFTDLDLDKQKPSKSHWWVWLLIFAGIAYGCYRLYVFETSKTAAITARKGAMKPRNIPVVAEAAWRGDMPVFLQGLGTVTPFNTVTVKPRVDGQLISVNYKEGQFVHKGDVLAEIDPRPFQVALEQAQGNLQRDEAGLKDAQANYLRDQELFKAQIIAKQQLDTQLATADQFRGSIQADQAAINSAKLNLTFTKITAPISGRIGLRQVDAGNIVHASDTTGLATITQVQPIAVIFTIPEDQLPPVLKKLRAGATLRTEAYDRGMTTKLADGTLLTVDNEIDTTTGTSRLKAVFPNTNLALFPNQFVNVKLWLDTLHNVTIIPAVAIQRGPGGETFVYVVRDDNTVTVRPVKVGRTEGNNVSIDNGLQPGDRVVVDGAEKLEEGMKVVLHQPTPGMGTDAAKRGQTE